MDEALTLVKESPAQALVLNGLSSEEMDSGRKALRTLPLNIPVIGCRALGERSAAERLGVMRCLVKPITRDVLLEAVESVPGPVRTIMIVDNEPEAVQLFSRILSSSGRDWRLLRATAGERALTMLEAGPPDLLLLDLIMPGVDGFQVLAHLRRDPNLAQLPVITISARDPVGAPVATDVLTVTYPQGLSAQTLLRTISVLAQTSAPWSRIGDPELAEMPVD
jgi:CheY-like chemotaxis protein